MEIRTKFLNLALGAFVVSSFFAGVSPTARAQGSAKKPNIVVIMGDAALVFRLALEKAEANAPVPCGREKRFMRVRRYDSTIRNCM